MTIARMYPEASMKHLDFSNTAVAFASLSDQQLRQALLMFRVMAKPWIVQMGPAFAEVSLKLRLPIQGLIKKTIFAHFCGGESIADCLPRIRQLGEKGVGTILDFAREGGGREEDFDQVASEIMKTIDMATQHRSWIPFAVFKPTGVASLELLSKCDQGVALSAAEQVAISRVKGRFEAICRHAANKRVRIMIDAEESWIQNTVDALAKDLMAELNREETIVFNTVQLYRHDRLDFIKRCHEDAKDRGYKLGLKLVRGAYLEKENKAAAAAARPSPLNKDKDSTDREYDQALRYCIEHVDRIALCVGTHNENSVRLATTLMAERGLKPNDDRIHFAQLLGMSDHISFNLAAGGFHVAKYMPYGTVEELLPYLTRRAQENSSVLGQSSRELTLLTSEYKRRKSARRSLESLV